MSTSLRPRCARRPEEVALDAGAAGLRWSASWSRFWIPVSDYAVTPVGRTLADRRPGAGRRAGRGGPHRRAADRSVPARCPDRDRRADDRRVAAAVRGVPRGRALRVGRDRAGSEPARGGAGSASRGVRNPPPSMAPTDRPDGALVAPIRDLRVPLCRPRPRRSGARGSPQGGCAMRKLLQSLVLVTLVAGGCFVVRALRLLPRHRIPHHPTSACGHARPRRPRRTTASPSRTRASTRSSPPTGTASRPSRSTSTRRRTPSRGATSTRATCRIRPASASRSGSTPSTRATRRRRTAPSPSTPTAARARSSTGADEILLRVGIKAR